MCLLALYEKVAQPQNLTFSQRKFYNFNFLNCSVNLRKKYSLKSTIFKHSVISLNFNPQSNREFLRYKALKMTFGQGP